MGNDARKSSPQEFGHGRTNDSITTPWGDAATLRERRLKPGASQTRAETERNQRERLFAALVACVDERGYEGTSVAHLVELSGVARSSFYVHFDDKQDCFLAAIDSLIGPPLERLVAATKAMDEAGDRAAFAALVASIAAQPAGARAFLVEAHAAGTQAAAALEKLFDALAEVLARLLDEEASHPSQPAAIPRAMLGGARQVIITRLLRRQEATLPELVPDLWRWLFCVPPPPGPLNISVRGLRARPFEQRQRGVHQTERVLRAMAAEVCERGYAEVTVAEIVERARTSQRTFYESFADKGAAVVAAVDSGSAQMLAAALRAFHGGEDWPSAVRLSLEAMLRFIAEEPEYGMLVAVEVHSAGGRALAGRERAVEALRELWAPGLALAPGLPDLTTEAIGGALFALLYDFLRERGPERVLELLPTATYLTLAPFLGAEEAYATAVG